MSRLVRMRNNFRADYTYEVMADQIIAIVDLDQGNRSVTNDIENVLADVQAEMGSDLSRYAVVYRDSMGYWDRVRLIDAGVVNLYPLRETDQEKAVTRLLHPLP